MKKIIPVFILACLSIASFAENAVLNLKVAGMHCGNCEMKFKSEAAKIKGIDEVKEVSAEKGTASILYNPAIITAEKAIQTLAENTGYTVTATTALGTVQVEGKPSGCCTKGQSPAACKKNEKSCKPKSSEDKP